MAHVFKELHLYPTFHFLFDLEPALLVAAFAARTRKDLGGLGKDKIIIKVRQGFFLDQR